MGANIAATWKTLMQSKIVLALTIDVCVQFEVECLPTGKGALQVGCHLKRGAPPCHKVHRFILHDQGWIYFGWKYFSHFSSTEILK